MSSEHQQLPLEYDTESSREILDSSNNIKDHEKLASETSSQGLDDDNGSSIQVNDDQDHLSEGVHTGSSIQVNEDQDQDHQSKCVDSSEGPSSGQMQDNFNGGTEKLASVSSDGDDVAGSEKSSESADKTEDSINLSNVTQPLGSNKVHIDTAAPIDSVKSAVSKFGGILDWKAHKVHTVERHKIIDDEIEKVQEEIPLYKEQAEIAEQSKVEMLKELENTKRLIEELKLNLEKSETEESQAKQDCELAQLRYEELEKGIAQEASVAAKTKLEMAKTRHEAAITDLKVVKDELESLQKEYASLLIEKDVAVKKAEEAIYASKEMEKTVERLTVELVSTKESLESANAAHMEAEEHRIGATMAKEQDLITWDKELKEAQQNLEKLNQQIDSAKELKSKLSTASSMLADLKAELATYMDPKISEDSNSTDKTHAGMQAAVATANSELEEVKRKMGKATDEVNCLKMASTSLKAELEKEQSELTNLRQREGMASIAVASLEAELDKIKSEIAVVQKREKEAREKMAELPKQLQQASKETDEAKLAAELAQQEFDKAKEEAELAKAGANTMESRLLAAQKEIDAARASERLALAAIKALQESESTKTTNDEDSNVKIITLSLEEYYELSKKAHEAEELANMKVAEAMSKIEVAKEGELRSMKQLEDAKREVEERKEALRVAMEKADKAQQGKLSVEQELRKRRAEHEQRRKTGELGQASVDSPTESSIEQGQGHTQFGMDSSNKTIENDQTGDVASTTHDSSSQKEETQDNETSPRGGAFGHSNTTKKKKKSLFPRFFMFLGRRHWKSSKS